MDDKQTIDSRDETAAQAESDRGVLAAYQEAVGKLVRLHNLLIFVVFMIGLGCLAFTQYRGAGIELPVWLTRVLVGLRIVLPLLALVVTTIFTSQGMEAAARENASASRIFMLYQRVRVVSMLMLGAASVFAGLCLIAGNTWGDLVLLMFAFGLLFLTRPSLAGFVYIYHAIQQQREEEAA